MRKFIFGLIIGGGIGSIASYLLTKRYLEEKYRSKLKQGTITWTTFLQRKQEL